MEPSRPNGLADFLRPGESILVTCCNLGRSGSRYSLAILTSAGVRWLDLDGAIDPAGDSGLTGLAAADKNCLVAVQGKRPRILRLGGDLTLDAEFACAGAPDLHSLAERDGVIYAASTGSNQIIAIDGRGGSAHASQSVRWSHAETGRDLIHLNSMCFGPDGALLLSMFGPRQPDGRRAGALVNADTGARVLEGLQDPHSLTSIGDGMLGFCESGTSSFCLLDPADGKTRRAQLSGYTRGCASTGRHFVVGASRWRGVSRSLGSVRQAPASSDRHANPWQRSSIYFLNPDLSIALQYDFTSLAPEIYDIAYVGGRFKPARSFGDAAGRRLDAIYDEIEHFRSAVAAPAAPVKAPAPAPPLTPPPLAIKLPPGIELPPGTALPAGTSLPAGVELPPGTDLDAPPPPPAPKMPPAPAPAPGKFHFVQKYDTDKFENGVMAEYIALFQGLRHKPVRMLEVGMGQGGSMRFFQRYFPSPESRFVGIDIDPPKGKFDPRTTVIRCDQNDSQMLRQICGEHGPFDVILDDGSHFAKETMNTFTNCHEHLVAGGFYIVEDWMAHQLGEEYKGMVATITHILERALAYRFNEIKVLKLVPGSTAIFRKQMNL